MVFLAYPVAETLTADVPTPVRVLGVVLVAAYLLGWSLWDEHALVIWFAMLALLLATVPIIGIEGIGMTPYLGVFAAVLVPSPWCKWTTTFSALLPLVSLVGGDLPAFFFLTV